MVSVCSTVCSTVCLVVVYPCMHGLNILIIDVFFVVVVFV